MGLFDLPGKKREVTTRRKNVAHSKNGKPFVRKSHPLHFWKRTFAWNDRRRLRKEATLAHKALVQEQKTRVREAKVERKLANINLSGAKRTGLVQEASRLEAAKLNQMEDARIANTQVAKLQLKTQLEATRLNAEAAKYNVNTSAQREREREQELRSERIEQSKHSAKLRDREIEVRNRNVALREKLAGIEARQAPTPDEIAGEQEARFLATAEAAGLTPKQLADAIKAQGGREAVLAAVGRTETTNAIATGVPVHDGEFARPAPPRARIKKDAEGNPVANGPLWAQ
jgi:hypothetical protein